MEWMKAGRPRKKAVEKVTAKPVVEEQEQEQWTREELMVFTSGYVALAAAVLRQCRKDHVKPEDEPVLCRDLIECYAENMAERLAGAQVVVDVEDDYDKENYL